MVFDNEFFTVPFMREVTITPNWTYILQRSSHSGAMDNIDLKNTCFTTDIDEDPRKNPSHKTSVAPEYKEVRPARERLSLK